VAALGAVPVLGRRSVAAASEGKHEQADVVVDFGSPVPDVPSMSGILHGMNNTYPPDRLIAPLRPNLWRIGNRALPPDLYDRVVGFGARLEFVLSDTWQYQGPGPYEDYGRWEDHVCQVAQTALGLDILWDVWNEPNIPHFWQGTRAQFFETYRRAYVVLRRVLGPEVWIGGPSLADTYDPAFLTAFLDFCVDNGCKVNFLSWHELHSRAPRIVPIADHLADAYASFVGNPDYADLQIQEVHINEVVGSADQYRPAEMWGCFYYLERGGANGACKACWRANDGTSNCLNNSLDGMVTPDMAAARSGWWVYKLYADGVETRVDSSTSNPQVVALASAASATDDAAQVLLGYFDDFEAAPTALIDLDLNNLHALPFLAGARHVQVQLHGLPNSGEDVLRRPRFLGEAVLPIRADDCAVAGLSPLRLHEGFALTLRRARRTP
jgi:hypothetical protein